MTAEVDTIRENPGIRDAAESMKSKKVHRLPVVDSDNRPTGMLSSGDLALQAGDPSLCG